MRKFGLAVLFVAATATAAGDPDLVMQTRIRQEGFRNSKIMEYAQQLTDVIGARLTGSPSMKEANDWTRRTFEEMGLANAHLHAFRFGRGWTTESTTVRMIEPETEQLYGLAKAWSPATSGPIRGKVVKVKLENDDDLEKQKGKLAGAIVLIGEARDLKPVDKSLFERYDEAELEKLEQYAIPASRDTARMREFSGRRAFRRKLAKFAVDEKIAAFIDGGSATSSDSGGLFRVQASGTWRDDESAGVPYVGLAAEHFNRIARLIDKKQDVELELDVKSTFHDRDLNAYNTIAELPGGDRKSEIVMLGAHLDSWHTGTGATDNAAGAVVMMEAMRILKAIGATPRRTIRVALWAGEEQGLLGSRAYVNDHFASRPEPTNAEERDRPASQRGPMTLKPEQAKVSAYFNLDNGTGKIRGVWAQENAAVIPIFTKWLEPLHDLGATTVTMRTTGSTDHVPFEEAGIPGFQFIQDEIEYSTRTHHSNWDTFERLQRDDLMQAAVVVATFVWETANRPELLPRKPMKPEDVAKK
jgi:carboxypeptidase Q